MGSLVNEVKDVMSKQFIADHLPGGKYSNYHQNCVDKVLHVAVTTFQGNSCLLCGTQSISVPSLQLLQRFHAR